MEKLEADIVIVGTGASGLFAALHVPNDKISSNPTILIRTEVGLRLIQ